ncbi:hypothetical protein EDD18DRAFT_1352484 [Armillaria luteobubalina]|uniref:Uncharacterized protein n=1 Tax=Armillaria luteobubalina TaxID=153913 RepID=A0AA39Q5I8_9AGAR|nr:hypothetical protein EDD18DRAFT_1352484 [Armillaria luteobubalina]
MLAAGVATDTAATGSVISEAAVILPTRERSVILEDVPLCHASVPLYFSELFYFSVYLLLRGLMLPILVESSVLVPMWALSCVTPPQPGTAVFARLPPVSVMFAYWSVPFRSDGVLQPTLARRVSYGDLTATEVAAVVDSGSEEEGSDAEHTGTQAGTSIHIAAHVDEDGSDDGSGTHNEFIDDITDKFSGQSSSDDAEEFYNCENVDAAGHDMPGSPNLSQTVDPPVVAAPAVQGHVDVPDNATHRASSRPKVKTKKALYVDTLSQDRHAADLVHEDDRCDPSVAVPQPSLTPEQLEQYAVDVACAVASQSIVSPPPATVYLEDLDGPPMPSQAATRSQNSKKKAMPVSLSQIPVHTSFGSMSSSDGVVPIPVKTMGVPTSSSASVTAKSKASAKTTSPPVSVDVPSLPPAAGDTPCSAVAASVGSSGKQPDSVFLASLDAFLGCIQIPFETHPLKTTTTITQTCLVLVIRMSPLLTCSVALVAHHLSHRSQFCCLCTTSSEPEDDVLRVMLPEIQEEQLRAHYAVLPGLGTVCVTVPISQDPSSFDQPCYVTIEDVACLFNKNTVHSLIAAQQFTGSGPYCNLSTLGHASVTCDGRKALYRGHAAVAGDGGCCGKRIGMRLPALQPWHRESTLISLLFDQEIITSENISTAGIFLATRALSTVQQNNNNRYPSPTLQKKAPAAKGGQSGNLTPSRSAWPKSPSKPTTLASRPVPEWEYYHCLGFNDEVPIFDGHTSKGSHFLFRSTDFTGLAALPVVPAIRT